jgi:hypothetical protein
MKEQFVYIISCQRGQRLPEIRSVWTEYDDAIVAYCEDLDNWDNQDFYLLHKFPVGRFCEPGEWGKEKLGKSSKNRLKFEEKELKNLLKTIRRNRQIDNILE